MRTSKAMALLAATLAWAPAVSRAQQPAADASKDPGRFMDDRRRTAGGGDQALKRELDIDVTDTDVRDVMDEIGRRVGKNIIVEQDVHEKVTVNLRKVPWREAVDQIARLAKCEVEIRGSILVLTQPPKVTIQFQDANVRTVLQLLAAYSGKNIIISPDVRGEITLDLRDVHWERALRAIVRTAGDYEVVSESVDLIRVVPRASINQQLSFEVIPLKYLRPPSKYLATPPRTSPGAGAGAGNLFVGTPPAPSGADAEFTLFRAIETLVTAARAQAAGTTFSYDRQRNAFFIRGTEPLIKEIRDIIARLDQEPAQLYVECRFIATADGNFLEHGLRPNDPVNGYTFAGPFPGGQTFTNGFVMPGKVTANGGNVDTVFQNLASPVPVGTFPFAVGTGVSRFADSFQIPAILDFRGLQATLNFIDRDTRTRLLQTPSLFLMDNEDAVIFVGENVPFAQINSSNDLNGNVIQTIGPGAGSPLAVGFSLFISAHVVPDSDRIMMTVIPRVSSPGGTVGNSNLFDRFQVGNLSLDLPHTREQALVTHIMLDDGQTAVIGGLLTEQDNEIITRFPILSRIPVLGNLFMHTHKEKGVNNLLILVTTTIVRSKSQSIALNKKHDAQWKARDYFYRKYEQPKEELRRKAAEADAPPPAAAPAPATTGDGK